MEEKTTYQTDGNSWVKYSVSPPSPKKDFIISLGGDFASFPSSSSSSDHHQNDGGGGGGSGRRENIYHDDGNSMVKYSVSQKVLI